MQLKILQADYGDSLLLQYLGNDQKHHNILIDGGLKRTYSKHLKSELSNLEGILDLVIITHIDSDHIGGILSAVQEGAISKKNTNTVWFNSGETISKYLNKDYDSSMSIKLPIKNQIKSPISIRQADTLEKKLYELNVWKENIIKCGQTYNIAGAKIDILSPDKETLTRLHEKWEKYDTKKIHKIRATTNDYNYSLEFLSKKKFIEDNSITNRSSIAFLFTHNKKKVLFLADAHPSLIVNSLKKLGYSEKNKIVVNYVKLSHHGSKSNTNSELLKMIDCENFIISTNGSYHNLPNKETFARILKEYNHSKINFLFNYNTTILNEIFSSNEQKEFNFESIYNCNIIQI